MRKLIFANPAIRIILGWKMSPISKTNTPLKVAFPSHGVLLLESHHDEYFAMQWRTDHFYKVFFVISGSGSLITQTQSWTLQTGSILFLPDQFIHRIKDQKNKPLSLFVLCVRPEKLETSLRAHSQMRHLNACVLDQNEREVFRIFKEISYEQTLKSKAWETAVLSLTQRLFIWMIRHFKNTDTQKQETSLDRVHRWILEMEKNFYQTSSLYEAAQKTGLSERRFTQLFRVASGTTWQKHLQKLRINHAKRLLQESQMSITTIAFASGFEDLSSFYRAFKTSEKIPPRKWKMESCER